MVCDPFLLTSHGVLMDEGGMLLVCRCRVRVCVCELLCAVW